MTSIPISSIMTKNVVSISPEQKLLDVKRIYEKKKFHHHIPVVEKEKLVGIVSLIDFMYKIKGAGLDDEASVYNELIVRDIMTSNPHSIHPDATIDSVAEEFIKNRYRALPVVSNHKLVGIVSNTDVIRYYLKNKNT